MDESQDNWWDLPIEEQSKIANQQILSVEKSLTLPSKKMLKHLYNPWACTTDDRRSQIKHLIPEIFKINSTVDFGTTYLPIMNITPNSDAFKVEILGFDGKTRIPANAMFDTGCSCDAVVGRNVAEKAGVPFDKFDRLSFVYIITVGEKEFVCYALSYKDGEQNKSKWTYIEDSRSIPGVVSCQGDSSDKWIDLLIGYRTLKEMSQRGLYVTAVAPTDVSPDWEPIPFCIQGGLESFIGKTRINMAIDSGLFIDVDFVVSIDFFRRNKEMFKFQSACTKCAYAQKGPCYLHGTISSLTLKYGDVIFTLVSRSFLIDRTGPKTLEDGTIIDCMGGRQLMKKVLPKYGVIPKIY